MFTSASDVCTTENVFPFCLELCALLKIKANANPPTPAKKKEKKSLRSSNEIFNRFSDQSFKLKLKMRIGGDGVQPFFTFLLVFCFFFCLFYQFVKVNEAHAGTCLNMYYTLKKEEKLRIIEAAIKMWMSIWKPCRLFSEHQRKKNKKRTWKQQRKKNAEEEGKKTKLTAWCCMKKKQERGLWLNSTKCKNLWSHHHLSAVC